MLSSAMVLAVGPMLGPRTDILPGRNGEAGFQRWVSGFLLPWDVPPGRQAAPSRARGKHTPPAGGTPRPGRSGNQELACERY